MSCRALSGPVSKDSTLTDWPTRPLGDVLELLIDHRGKTVKKLGGDFQDSGVRVVSAKNIKGSRIDDENLRYVSEEMFRKWMPNPLRKGDVLLTSEAPLGEVAYLSEDLQACLGQRLFALRADDSTLDGRYLFYALSWGPSRDELLSRATGTTVVGIRQAELVRVGITLPPLPEQRAIAEVLGALDDKIESNRRVVRTSESLLSALALGLRRLPKVPLSQAVAVARDTEDPTQYGDDLVDHFSIPAFDALGSPERVAATGIKSGKLRVAIPSVLVSRLNPGTPRVWVAEPQDVPALCSTEFLVLQPVSGSSLGAVRLAVAGQEFTEVMERRATGTSFSHQRIKQGDALSIEVPDVRELPRGIGDQADVLLCTMLQQRRETGLLTKLRDALLPALLSGRLRAPAAAELVEAQ